MQQPYRTLRIRSGLYLSVDSDFKIERMPQYFPGKRRWKVSRYMDGSWREMQVFATLAAARMYVAENVQGWWG